MPECMGGGFWSSSSAQWGSPVPDAAMQEELCGAFRLKTMNLVPADVYLALFGLPELRRR